MVLGIGFTTGFETNLDRFAHAFHQFVERLSLSMTARQFRHVRDIVTFGIALDADTVLARLGPSSTTRSCHRSLAFRPFHVGSIDIFGRLLRGSAGAAFAVDFGAGDDHRAGRVLFDQPLEFG